ncbi:MAG: hypothetical protein QW087_02000 [Methanomassiliicoccales archaeon]
MDIQTVYAKLITIFEVDGWWPAESPFEIMIGAILTQQTMWENVEKTIKELKNRGLLSVDSLVNIDQKELENIIRPVGFYRLKAKRIKALALHLRNYYDSNPMGVLQKALPEARGELMSIDGIGKETADAILLFAGRKPTFVAAKYCARVFMRLGLVEKDDYDYVKQFVEERMPKNPRVYAELYSLLVQLSKTYCRKNPSCNSCPLSDECAFSLSGGISGYLSQKKRLERPL